MRWQSEWHTGSKRIHQKFLVFPMQIGLQTRWLEVAKWEEVYHKWLASPGGLWNKERWIDD